VSFLVVTGTSFSIVLGWWLVFRWTHRGSGTFYFDPQDYFHSGNPAKHRRLLPKSAENATFEPMLKHYVGVTQLLVTVAAASIAFGANNNPRPATAIGIAKLLLAWSIFDGVLFCALLLWRYDEYTQDVKSYTLAWYSVVFALGFSSLTCFIFGYLVWGFGLV